MDEEDAPKPRRGIEQPVLDGLGLDELHGYIAALQAEISRANAMIARKTGDRSAADSVFGKR